MKKLLNKISCLFSRVAKKVKYTVKAIRLGVQSKIIAKKRPIYSLFCGLRAKLASIQAKF